MQEDEKKLYEIYIEHLKNSLLESTFNEVNQATSRLIEKQIYNLMLTSASESYVFKTLDLPFVPEEKSYPNRLLMLIISIIVNTILSFYLCFLKIISNFLKNNINHLISKEITNENIINRWPWLYWKPPQFL